MKSVENSCFWFVTQLQEMKDVASNCRHVASDEFRRHELKCLKKMARSKREVRLIEIHSLPRDLLN